MGEYNDLHSLANEWQEQRRSMEYYQRINKRYENEGREKRTQVVKNSFLRLFCTKCLNKDQYLTDAEWYYREQMRVVEKKIEKED